jgi:hypothetical protein
LAEIILIICDDSSVKVPKPMKPDIFSRVDASPTCKLSWDHIEPNQRQWFCSHCQHHVHNLSAMTKGEARRFMRSPSTNCRCISFLQDDEGRTIFRKPVLSLSFLGALTWLISSLVVLFAPGCASPQTQSMEKTATVAQSNTQNGNSEVQKSGKPLRRWTGY